jgi:putative transposase
MLRVVQDEATRAEFASVLDDIVREGARRMLAAALRSEADAYVAAANTDRDDNGHALVTRNGRGKERTVVTGAGALEVRAPRIDDQRIDEDTGERRRFRSEILPPYARKSGKVSHVLPLLYLHGMSSGDFRPALTEFFGSDCGLSPSAITRLTHAWQAQRDDFMKRSLRTATTFTFGSTACISTSGSATTTASVAWSSWVRGSTAPSSSPCVTATGSRPSRGRRC